jgi:hypothetical protein
VFSYQRTLREELVHPVLYAKNVSLFVQELQANVRRITEEHSELQKRSKRFDTELAATTKKVTEQEKV